VVIEGSARATFRSRSTILARARRTTMATQSGMVCPKCGGRMVAYERTRILVEQCEECRGIFLDHGELEQLVDAEGGGWSGRVVPPSVEPRPAVAADDEQSSPRRRGARDRQKTIRDLFGE
jgi:Zn-finger nucleic acid-binding protein